MSRRPRFRPILTPLEAREVPAVFTVVNESGDRTVSGSLPWAVDQANARAGFDRIVFDIPSEPAPFPIYSRPQVITLNAPLYLNDQVAVSGNSADSPGFYNSPTITAAGGVSHLFVLQASDGTTSSGSTIEGLALSGATDSQVLIRPASTNNWVQGNIFFTSVGAHVLSDQNTIRNNMFGANNGGMFHGVVVGEIDSPETPWSGISYQGNSIQDNTIGYDYVDSRRGVFGPFRVASVGLLLTAGARNNFVGPGNAFEYAGVAGVAMLNPSTTGNVVFGNTFTDNAKGVIVSGGAAHNVVGGAFGGNVIGGPRYAYESEQPDAVSAISLGDPRWGPAYNTLVMGNVVGLTADQTTVSTRLPTFNYDPSPPGKSFQYGVIIETGSRYNAVQGNVIANIELNGVTLAYATDNFVTGNWLGRSYSGTLFGNTGFGVAAITGAAYNNLSGNVFGFNLLGPVYVGPDAFGNFLG